MTLAAIEHPTDYLRALPGDDVRQLLWRFADRYDLQMLVQSVRAVARGPVARLVASGARNTHEWTPDKQALLQSFDESGITGVFMDPAQGGFIEGPKNLALALVAFELAWVDAGAATGSLAGCLALSPIHERGTGEQRDIFLVGDDDQTTGGSLPDRTMLSWWPILSANGPPRTRSPAIRYGPSTHGFLPPMSAKAIALRAKSRTV